MAANLPEVSDPSYCVECGCNEAVHADGWVTNFNGWERGDALKTDLPVPWCASCDQWCSGTYDGDTPPRHPEHDHRP